MVATAATDPASTSVCRGPAYSESQPSSGAPTAAETEPVTASAASTRPRIAPSVSSWARVPTVVSMITAAAAIGRISAAKLQVPGASPAAICRTLASRPAPTSVA
jgi:hypothetical protein